MRHRQFPGDLRALPVFLFLVLATLGSSLPSVGQPEQKSPYFSELGPTAYHRYLNDLGNPLSVLFVAVRPGEEDLPAIVSFRLQRGARVGIVYVTNGESLPNQAAPENIAHTAARRKEEATALARYLDCECQFLNLPDGGVVPDAGRLRAIWPADSLSKKLRAAITSFAPDLVLLNCWSPLTQNAHVVGPYLRQAVSRLVEEEESKSLRGGTTTSSDAVLIQRVVSDSYQASESFTVPTTGRIRIFGKTPTDIGLDAGRLYKSLQYTKHERTPRAYGLIYSRSKAAEGVVDSHIEPPSPAVKELASRIGDFCRRADAAKPRTVLSPLADLIEVLNKTIRTEGTSFAPAERRLLSKWDHGLEDLRCNILNVRVRYTFDEPVISRMQLFRIRFDKILSATSGGSTEVFFPQKSPEWIINTGLQKIFPLKTPAAFEVLSQNDIAYDTPASEYGIMRNQLGTEFLYAIVHHGRTREENFIYQRELTLRVAPKRSFELMNSVVSGLPDEWIAFKAVNYSRDPGEGSAGTADSMLQPVLKNFRLPQRYSVVADTIPIHPVRPLPPGTYRVQLRAPGNTPVPVTLRSFECKVDSSVKAGLITRFRDGPLARSLQKLGVRPLLIEHVSDTVRMRYLQVMVVDEDTPFPKAPGRAMSGAIEAWVQEGGRLIVLSRVGSHDSEGSLWGNDVFADGSPTAAEEILNADQASTFARTPNLLGADDWREWIFAKAFGTITSQKESVDAVLLRNERQQPVIASRTFGKGTIIYVALNLDFQLLEAVPGAYRLLSNLLSY